MHRLRSQHCHIVPNFFQFLRNHMLRAHFRRQMSYAASKRDHVRFQPLEALVDASNVANFSSFICASTIPDGSTTNRAGRERGQTAVPSSTVDPLTDVVTGHPVAEHFQHFAVHGFETFQLITDLLQSTVRFGFTDRLSSVPWTSEKRFQVEGASCIGYGGAVRIQAKY